MWRCAIARRRRPRRSQPPPPAARRHTCHVWPPQLLGMFENVAECASKNAALVRKMLPAEKKTRGGKVKNVRKPAALSGYITFGKSARDTIKKKHGFANAPQKDVMQEIARQWKALSEEEHAQWKERGVADFAAQSGAGARRRRRSQPPATHPTRAAT